MSDSGPLQLPPEPIPPDGAPRPTLRIDDWADHDYGDMPVWVWASLWIFFAVGAVIIWIIVLAGEGR